MGFFVLGLWKRMVRIGVRAQKVDRDNVFVVAEEEGLVWFDGVRC